MIDGFLFGWAAGQDAGKRQAGYAADRANITASSARTEAELLKLDIERLMLVSQALWEILRDKFGYTEQQLAEKIIEIDARDGKLDGKVAKQPPTLCPKCGRGLSPKRPRCLFCGAVVVEPFKR